MIPKWETISAPTDRRTRCATHRTRRAGRMCGMPPRKTPTARQARLGAELRKMRERAGLTASGVAVHLGTDPTKVSQLETGKAGISPERLRSFASACKCGNEQLIEALAAMTQERGKGWWEGYRDGGLPSGFLDIAEMEHHAEGLEMHVTTYIPGLLQTGEYAAAVLARSIPPLSRHELDARTAFRIQRHRVLSRWNEETLICYIHEAALRMQFGGRGVLLAQLESLLGNSELPGVTIRVTPFSADTFPGAGENICYARGATAELDTVQLDLSGGPQFLVAGSELDNYRAIFDRLDRTTLQASESRDFIRSVMQQI